MAGSDWTIEYEGLDEAERKTARMALALLDLRPFWPKVVPLFIEWMRLQFATEGAFAGQPWAPLSSRYLAWKTRVYPGKPILQAEGNLRRAASLPLRTATPNTLTLTIRDPKIVYHQTGTPQMPARPLVFSDLPLAAEIQLAAAAREYVDDLARRVGFAV